MIDITKEPWWLARDVWGRMSVAERREHCINVNAYFRAKARLARHELPNDVADRLAAESEMEINFRRCPGILLA